MKMELEAIEKNSLEQVGFHVNEKLSSFHKSFQSSLLPENGVFSSLDNLNIDETIKESFGLGQVEITPEIQASVVDTVKDIYYGTNVDGHQSLGLNEISHWKIDPNYYESNLCQHAGYAAEVISTSKENLLAKVNGTGVQVFRADDMPEDLRKQFDGKIAAKNDQYVDKVRVKADGTVETVQTKFVGNDADSCLKKLTSKKYDKYLEDGKVDKIEIPKEYYDDVKKKLGEKKEKLLEQYEKNSGEAGKSEVASGLDERIEKLDKLDSKLEASCVTKSEAKFAVEHPKLYAAGQINKEGLKSGAQAAALTAAVSGVQNYQAYKAGDISAKEAVTNVAKESAISGGIAYGTEIVTQLAGGSSVPAAVISMGVESYDDIKEFAKGEISGSELAYNLGENAVQIAGASVGGMVGGAVGSVAGPVGSIAGGMVGSSVGSAVASNAYKSAVEYVSDNMDSITAAGSELGETVSHTASGIAASVKVAAGDMKKLSADKIDAAADKASDIKKAASSTITNLFKKD